MTTKPNQNDNQPPNQIHPHQMGTELKRPNTLWYKYYYDSILEVSLPGEIPGRKSFGSFNKSLDPASSHL